MVSMVVDLYPRFSKRIPDSFKGHVSFVNGIFNLIIWYWVNITFLKYNVLHFNFSRFNSVLLFVFIPKRRSRWVLMLHHGNLKNNWPKWFILLVLNKFDYICCINSAQRQFYIECGVMLDKLCIISSYIPPILTALQPSVALKDIDEYFLNGPTLVASGFPSRIYNHDWCIRYVQDRPHLQLAIFLYGNGDCEEYIYNATSNLTNVRVFRNCNQETFNYYLSKALCYLRPNARDSFGIAVADAISFGVKTLASDVCDRYPGSYIFSPDGYSSFAQALDTVLGVSSADISISNCDIHPFSYNALIR